MANPNAAARPAQITPTRPTINVEPWRLFGPILLAAGYHWLLCFGTNFGLPVSRFLIGAAEVLVLALILGLGKFSLSPRHMGAALILLIYITALWALRGGEIDIKPLRDILVAMIAFWYGTQFKLKEQTLDQGVLIVSVFIIVVGALEYTDLYAALIDTFKYYAATGAIDPSNAMVEGQTVTLNGLRPESIGRTLFPSLLSQQRISSIFLEPVGMGNFGVIVAAWALSKPYKDWKIAVCLLTASFIIFSLADSRFGIATLLLMSILRFALPANLAASLALVLPVFAAIGTVFVSMFTREAEDNFAGRLSYSGRRLLELDALSFMGITRFDFPYFDTGYPYAITRFGLLLLIALWLAFFLVPVKADIAARFRVNMSVYISLVLTISGTSAFAFKTSVFLWALFGASTRLDIAKLRK